jgi:hypothetical protein
MKTFVLTCPELDGGRRKTRFKADRFPCVEFVSGMPKNRVKDHLNIAANPFNFGFEDSSWDAGAIAVAYGHLKIWQQVVGTNQICLILEDDARPVPRFRFNYFKLPAFVDSCRLSGLWALSLWKSGVWSYEVANRKLFKLTPSFSNSGAIGYVLGPVTAQFLIDGFSSIACPVDHYLLGMGFRDSPEYSVYVTRRDRIFHADSPSIRAETKRGAEDRNQPNG